MNLIKKLGVATIAVVLSVGSVSAGNHRGGAVAEFFDGYPGLGSEGRRGAYVAEVFDSEGGDLAKAIMGYERCVKHNPNDYQLVCDNPLADLDEMY